MRGNLKLLSFNAVVLMSIFLGLRNEIAPVVCDIQFATVKDSRCSVHVHMNQQTRSPLQDQSYHRCEFRRDCMPHLHPLQILREAPTRRDDHCQYACVLLNPISWSRADDIARTCSGAGQAENGVKSTPNPTHAT
jgi:hypothetical protein